MSPAPARRLRERLAVAGSLVAVLLGLAVTAGWFLLRSSLQEPRGALPVDGLAAPVSVHLDPFGIPHVFAETEADLFRAQGWLHASDRLWQIELLHRTARGRVAELFGDSALDLDRFVRTLDLWGSAGRSLEALPERERRLLEAYAAGVNGRIASWSGPWPPEFLALRVEPEPWSPQASVAVGRIMSLDLSTWRPELSRFRAAALLDEERRAWLEPRVPAWGPTVLEEPWPPMSTAAEDDAGPGDPAPDPPSAAPAGLAAPGESPPVRRLPDAGSSVARGGRWDPLRALGGLGLGASNAWAVSGVRTEEGSPLLASDMHLPLRVPSTWYLNALHAAATELRVAGLSIPGAPGVVVGYNPDVAWGFTNAMVDDMDFVVETVREDGAAYRDGGRWMAFAARPETIRVRGRDAPVVHVVRETRRGPVVSDVLPPLGATLSLLWTGRRPTSELVGLLAMNEARDATAFDRAVRRFDAPHQNVVYATAAGEIGYRMSGTVPRRRWDGSVPAPADRVGSGWLPPWPAAAHPALRQPARGYIVTANNLQAQGLLGVVGTEYPPPFRARRIADVLERGTAWTGEGMQELQRDVRSLLADRAVDRAAAAARRLGEDAAAARLEAWDRRADVASQGAPLFYAWLQRLRILLAGDEWARDPAWAYLPDAALLRTLEEGGGPWVDDVRTEEVETLEALEERALADAARATRRRTWGEVHRERSVHPLGRVWWLNRLLGLDVGPYPAPGGPYTVRPDDPMRWARLDTAAWRPPYVGEYGPSERFVARLRPGRSEGHFLLPTGQSGHPLSPHYRDMALRWPEAELVPVPLDPEAARERAARTFRLLPR